MRTVRRFGVLPFPIILKHRHITVADELSRVPWYELDDEKQAVRIVKEFPAADVVEVVRCKDCRWGREVCGNIECSSDLNAPTEYHGYEWFCPNGERMDEVEE